MTLILQENAESPCLVTSHLLSTVYVMNIEANMALVVIVSTSSGRIPCPHPGRIWLEQRGLQRALYWHIEARVVLDLHECLDSVSTLVSC